MQDQTVSLEEYLKNSIDGKNAAFLLPLDGRNPLPIEGIFTIGRSPSNTLCLRDVHVSHEHCQLEKRPLGYFVRDLRSRNGVKVDGVKVTEAQLKDGSQIQVGESEFIFQMQSNEVSGPLVSKNQSWNLRLQSLKSISSSQLPVFLQGESGTGKEVLSQLVHGLSSRKSGPFVGVNCSALTESLVESELFGHMKGSFTGATSDRKGAFEAARKGTLFLDEIGDLSPALQPKLLRALENQEIRPVGSDKLIKTDVRIITATHKNLEELVSEGKFRADLFFRIHVVKFPIPALRDRLEDLEDLLQFFSREMRVRFTTDAIKAMKRHSWPGNIRELKNVVARASALYPGYNITPAHVGVLLDTPVMPGSEKSASTQLISKLASYPYAKQAEKEMIQKRLIINKGNQRRTASELGMPKSTLHDKIKSYRIDLDSITNLDRFEEQLHYPTVVEDAVDGELEAQL